MAFTQKDVLIFFSKLVIVLFWFAFQFLSLAELSVVAKLKLAHTSVLLPLSRRRGISIQFFLPSL